MIIRLMVAIVLSSCVPAARAVAQEFDHSYAAYAAVLRDHVAGSRVDYAKLVRNRAALEQVVRTFAAPPAAAEASWPRLQRMAFWINAYNAFTLQSIVNHYPIQGSWFSLYPRNSIRQISGVWNRTRWKAAGREVTLDQIEHEILRPTFMDARIHFAVNCASVSCPPLRAEPYRGDALESQLDDGARRFLSSELGLRVDGTLLHVSSIFDWYGDDFVRVFAGTGSSPASPKDRAILGTVTKYGTPAGIRAASNSSAQVRYLDYDWSLNDISR